MAADFADELGPLGRRRVRQATALTAVVLTALAIVALHRLTVTGQLTPKRWADALGPEALRFIAGGIVATVRAAGAAGALAVAFGGVLALGRLARSTPVRWAAGAYVEFFRALPLLTLLIFLYFGLPKLGISLSVFVYLVLGLAIYNGAVLGEIFRAGILSLERGQMDAALAVGLSHGQAMRLVVIPQAVRRMVPAIVSQLVTLLKDTSLGAIITYEELLRRGQLAGEYYNNLLQILTVVAAIYVAVNASLSRAAARLERRQRRRYQAGGIQVRGGPEDLVLTGEGGTTAT